MFKIPSAGRLALVLVACALAFPAQAQERFYQACVTEAGADLPPGVSADALCGCAAQRTLQAGAAAADLDALIDYVDEGQTLDVASVPERLQPTVALASEALMGCVLQVGFAGMMEASMGEAMQEAMQEAMGEASASVAAPAEPSAASQAPATAGLPGELVAEGPWALGAATGSAASPDGTAASGTAPAVPDGFRTGAGRAPRRTSQSSKGAAIRILE